MLHYSVLKQPYVVNVPQKPISHLLEEAKLFFSREETTELSQCYEQANPTIAGNSELYLMECVVPGHSYLGYLWDNFDKNKFEFATIQEYICFYRDNSQLFHRMSIQTYIEIVDLAYHLGRSDISGYVEELEDKPDFRKIDLGKVKQDGFFIGENMYLLVKKK